MKSNYMKYIQVAVVGGVSSHQNRPIYEVWSQQSAKPESKREEICTPTYN